MSRHKNSDEAVAGQVSNSTRDADSGLCTESRREAMISQPVEHIPYVVSENILASVDLKYMSRPKDRTKRQETRIYENVDYVGSR